MARKLDKTEARQGVTGAGLRRVLAVSLALAAFGFLAVVVAVS